MPHRRLLRPPVVRAARAAPLVALPFEPVDVHRGRDAARAKERDERCVRSVEHERRVGAVPLHLACATESAVWLSVSAALSRSAGRCTSCIPSVLGSDGGRPHARQ